MERLRKWEKIVAPAVEVDIRAAADRLEALTAPVEGIETTAEGRARLRSVLLDPTISELVPYRGKILEVLADADKAAHLNALLAAEKDNTANLEYANIELFNKLAAAEARADDWQKRANDHEDRAEKYEAALREAHCELSLAVDVASFTAEQKAGCAQRALTIIDAALGEKP